MFLVRNENDVDFDFIYIRKKNESKWIIEAVFLEQLFSYSNGTVMQAEAICVGVGGIEKKSIA